MKIHINSEFRAEGELSEDFTVRLAGLAGSVNNEHLFRVESVQLPLTFYQIRPGVNNSFEVSYSNFTNKIIYLTGGNFGGNPSASQISANIKTQMDVNTASQIFTITTNTVTGTITIVSNANSYFELRFINDPKTAQVMGFDLNSVNAALTGTLTSPKVINLSPVDSIFIKSDITIRRGSDYENYSKGESGIICKIPTTQQGVNMFGNLFWQNADDEMRVVERFVGTYKFALYYPSGERVNLNGHDWSFTITYQN